MNKFDIHYDGYYVNIKRYLLQSVILKESICYFL